MLYYKAEFSHEKFLMNICPVILPYRERLEYPDTQNVCCIRPKIHTKSLKRFSIEEICSKGADAMTSNVELEAVRSGSTLLVKACAKLKDKYGR